MADVERDETTHETKTPPSRLLLRCSAVPHPNSSTELAPMTRDVPYCPYLCHNRATKIAPTHGSLYSVRRRPPKIHPDGHVTPYRTAYHPTFIWNNATGESGSGAVRCGAVGSGSNCNCLP